MANAIVDFAATTASAVRPILTVQRRTVPPPPKKLSTNESFKISKPDASTPTVSNQSTKVFSIFDNVLSDLVKFKSKIFEIKKTLSTSVFLKLFFYPNFL